MARHSVVGCTLMAVLAASCARGAYVKPSTEPRPAARANAVPKGTLAAAELHQVLSTESREGDRFTAELLDPLVGEKGEVLVERGAVLEGRVVRASSSRLAGDAAEIELQVVGLRQDGSVVPLPLEVAQAEVDIQSGWRRATLAGLAGAAAGAGTGVAIDDDSAGIVLASSVIGAGVGALLASIFGNREARIESGSVLTLRLTEDVEMPPGRPVEPTPPGAMPEDDPRRAPPPRDESEIAPEGDEPL